MVHSSLLVFVNVPLIPFCSSESKLKKILFLLMYSAFLTCVVEVISADLIL